MRVHPKQAPAAVRAQLLQIWWSEKTTMVQEEPRALRSWICPTQARPAHSREVLEVSMTAHRGRPRMAPRLAVEQVVRLAARPSRWTREPPAPPTRERAQAQEARVRLEQPTVGEHPTWELAPRARPMRAQGLGPEAGRRAVRQGVAGVAELPRSDPVRRRRKARSMTAMWQVPKQLERQAHPTCPRRG